MKSGAVSVIRHLDFHVGVSGESLDRFGICGPHVGRCDDPDWDIAISEVFESLLEDAKPRIFDERD